MGDSNKTSDNGSTSVESGFVGSHKEPICDELIYNYKDDPENPLVHKKNRLKLFLLTFPLLKQELAKKKKI
jgi:hypothetical protein